MSEPGLDYAFLQFIGATPESQKHWQRFYVPMFAECRDVLDVGCGSGDFLEMAAEQGARVHGVDLDPQCCADARGRGFSVDCADVLEYLRGAAPEQFDGVFCAHLIEHLPYEAVLEVVRGAWRTLRPGGRLVLVTPNARALYAHLGAFYEHFGHVSFYHPNLMRFFLTYAGFERIETGTNPTMSSPEWGNLRGRVLDGFRVDVAVEPVEARYGEPVPVAAPRPLAAPAGLARGAVGDDPLRIAPARGAVGDDLPRIAPGRELPQVRKSLLGRVSYRLKNILAQWLVLPYLDDLTAQVNAALAAAGQRQATAEQRQAELADALAGTLAEHAAVANEDFGNLTHSLHALNVSLGQTNLALNTVYVHLGRQDENWLRAAQGFALAAERMGLLVDALEQVDESWEAYAVAFKPVPGGASL